MKGHPQMCTSDFPRPALHTPGLQQWWGWGQDVCMHVHLREILDWTWHTFRLWVQILTEHRTPILQTFHIHSDGA